MSAPSGSATQPLPLERIREIHAAHKEGRSLVICLSCAGKPCADEDEPCGDCGGLGVVPEPEPPEAA